ncbi:MAG TPA: S8 family serine peptidase [Hyphomicrobiaceae bacterium]|nr:S8 family serine peptidase [Hyphomicrobiaceae bacterium]
MAVGACTSRAGTWVVVIDDGFGYNHSCLSPNCLTSPDFDWDSLSNGRNGDHDFDPFGQVGDAHGTAVNGIIGSDDNGTGAVGVACSAILVGYRTHGFISDARPQDIRDSIHHAIVTALADIANPSLSLSNSIASVFGAGVDAARFTEFATSIGTAMNSGRGGLGMTIVKSAGNSRDDGPDSGTALDLDDVNADPWTRDTRQVVVAAADQTRTGSCRTIRASAQPTS